MTKEEAINVVKNNWPDSSYTRLQEALKTLIPELKESEDERIRKDMLAFCERASSGQVTIMVDKDTEDFKSWIAWLEKQGEQKPAWSEEDERIYRTLIHDAVESNLALTNTQKRWLKSLKPQPHWKPSDKQMEALRVASEVGTANESWAMEKLKSLYSDLQKL